MSPSDKILVYFLFRWAWFIVSLGAAICAIFVWHSTRIVKYAAFFGGVSIACLIVSMVFLWLLEEEKK